MDDILINWTKKQDSEYGLLDRPRAAFPVWGRTTTELRAIYLQRVLQERADDHATHAWTLNVSTAIEAAATASGMSFLEFMQKKIAAAIKRRIAGAAEFWFVMEIAKSGRPHLHGSVAVPNAQLAAFKDALQSTAQTRGAPPEPRAVVVKPITDAAGWAEYATKIVFRQRYTSDRRLITATKDLRKAAEDAYKADRSSYWWAVKPEKMNPLYGIF